MTFTKKSLAVILSKLEVFTNPNAALEQYPTDSEVAADILWTAALKGDVKGKVIADLGCGTGVLGIGCLLLGAKKVAFIDIDKNALDLARKNHDKIKSEYEIGDAEFILSDIAGFNGKFDVVVENPPFGVQDEHADKKFLEKAFEISPLICSLHKIESKSFIDKISKDNDFEITEYTEFDFPLKQTMEHHKRRIYRIRVGCWRLEKKDRKS